MITLNHNWRRHTMAAAITATMVTAVISSCNTVFEDLPPCGVELHFAYDYNMEFADAFPAKVDCLSLLVYDEAGNLVSRMEETSQALSTPDYSVNLDVEPGTYNVVAYGGMACSNASFSFVEDPAKVNSSRRQVAMATAKEGVSSSLLHPHFYGAAQVTMPLYADEIITRDTVYMMKNTNNFRIVLQQLSGMPVDPAAFKVEIVDNNTLFAADNSILRQPENVTYTPWASGQVAVGENASGSEALVAYYELSTSRLMRGADARLRITRTDGATICDIPLINYLMLFKSDVYQRMPAQEFLDRMSEWNMIFFLDDKFEWLNTFIVINNWTVRINDINMIL